MNDTFLVSVVDRHTRPINGGRLARARVYISICTSRLISSSEVGRKVEIRGTEVEDVLAGRTGVFQTNLSNTLMNARVSEQRSNVKEAKQRSKQAALLHGMAFDGQN